jgi:3-phytase
MRGVAVAVLASCLAACSTAPRVASGFPAAAVTAAGETEPVGELSEDAADDPAIWRNPADPSKSLIVATDKKAGMVVYDLTGKRLFADSSGRVNNVDLADMGAAGIIVVASDRNDPMNAKLRVWRLDGVSGSLNPLGTVTGGTGEGYGLCLWKAPDGLHAFSVLKDGSVEEYRLELGGQLTAQPVREMKLRSQAEGCVADPRDGMLYVGEEDVAIWRFAPGAVTGDKIASADNRALVADIEGLTLMPEGATGGYLIASSQGDSAYAVFRLPDMALAGRFRIAAGAFGGTEETDGIAVAGGSFGPLYPGGLFVAQDGVNAPRAQNFKLVSWTAVLGALGIEGNAAPN